MKSFAKIRFHAFLWVLMLSYFVFAPDIFTLVFMKYGKPLQTHANIPAESDRIHFVIEELMSYVKDGEQMYQLIGWSFILPEKGSFSDRFVPEVVLVSDEQTYLFSVDMGHRKPKIPSQFADVNINYETLGLTVLMAEDVIKPGKYRIGVIFRNTVDGSGVYRDKPVYYLVKTPNTLRLEGK
jgi:hypothetical protein